MPRMRARHGPASARPCAHPAATRRFDSTTRGGRKSGPDSCSYGAGPTRAAVEESLKDRRKKTRRERRRSAGESPSTSAPSTLSPEERASGGSAPADRDLRPGVLQTLGLGIIKGAADDDPSAVGTYASAGAKLGPSFLWTAPVLFPMMFVAVYLSSKLGQVTGRGLFRVIRENYPRWVLYS